MSDWFGRPAPSCCERCGREITHIGGRDLEALQVFVTLPDGAKVVWCMGCVGEAGAAYGGEV